MKPGMRGAFTLLAVLLAAAHAAAPPAGAYLLNRTIAAAGGCPELNRFDTSNPAVKKINRRWSVSPNSAIRTTTGPWTGTSAQNAEVLQSIERSYAAWTGVSGTTLTPAAFAALGSTATANACSTTDGLNTICFNQTTDSFASGVLAFARVVTSDILGEKPFPNSGPSAFIGEILDADVVFRHDGAFTFATPGALTSSHFDLESVLIHELGHVLGFSHSAVWRAIMWPFAPLRGTFTGDRPTPGQPDANLADDDRTGLRVLYPDPGDTVHVGSIRGRVVPANPLALAGIPDPSPGRPVTGMFGAHVVAVDADSGQVVAAVIEGWSCNPADLPTRFDGSYRLERLPVGRNYFVYAEPLGAPLSESNFGMFRTDAFAQLCRAGTTNNCTVPAEANKRFNTRIRPSP